jgi:hypothetical protein
MMDREGRSSVGTYAWASRTRPNNVTRRERKLMVMRWSIGEVFWRSGVSQCSGLEIYPVINSK